MIRAMRAIAFIAVAIVAAITSCNGPEPIGGEPCRNPLGADAGGVFAYSPALECASRICLVEAPRGGSPAYAAVCTRECASDSDCLTRVRIQCDPGYGCGSVAGYTHRVCVCSLFLDGGTQ
jgi:hypothetical protein